jgi:hypothetical protein
LLFFKLFTKKSISDVIRNKDYIVTFKRYQCLQLDLWTSLVKYRASYKCEKCEKTINLNSHHIKSRPNDPKDISKNYLANGICLCDDCHGKAHQIKVPNYMKLPSKWFGKRWIKAARDGATEWHKTHPRGVTVTDPKEIKIAEEQIKNINDKYLRNPKPRKPYQLKFKNF